MSDSHTAAYYAALQEVQGGSYQPTRDATPWVAFCVEAHLSQAHKRLEQVAAAGARWAALERLAEERAWPDRIVIALEQRVVGGTDRALYGSEADVSTATASTDLRRLVDAGLILAQGRGRATRYRASDGLRHDVGHDVGNE